MANTKISNLTALTSPDTDDVLAIVDTSETQTKKITWANLLTAIAVSDGDKGDITVSGSGATWTIDDEAVTLAKMAHIATASILGRDTAGTGDVEVLSAADVRTLLNVEDGADVTDTANVTSAGALMDSEVNNLSGIKTLTVPDNTTISTFGASLIDDADASTARTTLGVDPAGTDNSTDVTLAGTPDYLSLSGQEITLNQIDLTTDVTDRLPFANLATGTARSVVGRAGSGNGDVGNISAGNDTILSRNGSGNVAFNSVSTVRSMLNVEDGATADQTTEEIQDAAWDVLTGTQTLITVTYDDANNNVDFVVDDDLSNYDNTTSGFITDYTVTEGDVTAHEGALTIAASQVTEISNLTAAEGAQLENINSVTITNTQWGYLGSSDQALATTDNVTFNNITADGELSGGIFTESHASNHTLTNTECFGAVYYVTGAATLTLPAVEDGMSLTVITIGAVAVSVDPNSSDKIWLDGTALDDGDKITNTSTSGDIAVLTYYSADGWHASTNGWTDGGA